MIREQSLRNHAHRVGGRRCAIKAPDDMMMASPGFGSNPAAGAEWVLLCAPAVLAWRSFTLFSCQLFGRFEGRPKPQDTTILCKPTTHSQDNQKQHHRHHHHHLHQSKD